MLPPTAPVVCTPWFLKVCCGESSALAAAFEQRGWRVTRFTEKSPSESDVSAAVFKEAEFQAAGGGIVVIWWSLPWTGWSRWTAMNLIKGGSAAEKVRRERARSNQLAEHFAIYNGRLLSAGAFSAFEWPRSCFGWNECVRVKEYCSLVNMQTANFDGCMLGIKSTDGEYLKKPMRVVTTLRGLAEKLNEMKCDGTHLHGRIEGKETVQTGVYPQKMAEFICKAIVDSVPKPVVSAMQVEEETKSVDEDKVMDAQLQEEMRRSGLEQVSVSDIAATTGAEKEEWLESMGAELNAMKEMNVFEELTQTEQDKLKPKEVMPAKMVCGMKPADEAGLRRKKSRLVACGNFTHKYGGEVKTHALEATLVRAMLAYSEHRKWEARALDIDTAFLHGEFPEDHKHVYYIRAPQILIKLGLVNPGTVWKLKRPLYGLRESPRCWGTTRDKKLADLKIGNGLRLVRSVADHSLWTIMKDQEVVGLLGTYVDDFLLVGESEVLDAVAAALETVWKLKRRGVIRQGVECSMEFLGMEFVRTSSGTLVCHQRAYIDDLLARWNMKDANPAKLTGEPESFRSHVARQERIKQDERPQHELDTSRKRAQGVIGGLLWLSTRTRPDIVTPWATPRRWCTALPTTHSHRRNIY